MGISVKQILDHQRAHLGIKENPLGSNKTEFGVQYGLNGVAWCAIFQSCMFQDLDALSLVFGKNQLTPTWAKKFYDAKQWGMTPRAGALVFFAWGTAEAWRFKGIQHIGIVEAVNADGTFYAIEGNVNSRVSRVKRSMKNVAMFGYPKYDSTSTGGSDVEYRIVGVESKTKVHRDTIARMARENNAAHAVLGRTILFFDSLEDVKEIEAYIAAHSTEVKRTNGVRVEGGQHHPLNNPLPHGAFTDEEAFGSEPSADDDSDAVIAQLQGELDSAESAINAANGLLTEYMNTHM